MSQLETAGSATNQARVGIVSDTTLQRHLLKIAVESIGLEIAYNLAPERFNDSIGSDFGAGMPIDLLIVEVENEDLCEDFVDQVLEHMSCPILFGLGAAPEKHSPEYPRWERRLHAKLRDFLGDIDKIDDIGESVCELEAQLESQHPVRLSSSLAAQPRKQIKIEEVWILAASLGGPEAVKLFLDSLPEGLPVGFIYAQHIDANFSAVLAKVLARHSVFSLKIAETGDQPGYGEVLLVPVDREMVFDELGRICFKSTPWPGPYGPSIDQVLLNVAEHYGNRCHAIFFSGMGNDGAIAAPMLSAYGSTIWVQEPSSCANSSMACSVADTGCAEFTGTPDQLAAHLISRFEAKNAGN